MSDDSLEKTPDDEENFAALLESYSSGMSDDVQVGDRIRGEIIAIGQDTVFVDTGTKIDGVVEKTELLDENGDLPHTLGDMIELYVVSRDGNEIRLSKAVSGAGGLRALKEAHEKGMPVEGKVKAPCKGGFEIDVMSKRAFCPVSQMDLKYVEDLQRYVGDVYPFLIIQFEEGGRNIVVSRRELLNRELQKGKEVFLKDLAVGAELEGQVTRIMPYGAFVELFPGIEGMAHISELSWSRLDRPDEAVREGERVSVKVIGIEQGEKSGQLKIALSIKQTTGDPWDSVQDKFQEGEKVQGKVTRCVKFGAFVEIAPGIEGLVHISEMSYRKRIVKPQDVVGPGDTVPVVIKEMDVPKKRISLSIKDAEGDPWMDIERKYSVGQTIRGIIEKKEPFGYFISLEPGITGLLPKSKIAGHPKPASIEKLKQEDPIAVVIEKIDPEQRRISLGIGEAGDEGDWRAFTKDKQRTLGSLGEKLQQALSEKKDT